MMKKATCLKNIFDSRLYQFICKYHSKIPQYNNKLKNENQTVFISDLSNFSVLIMFSLI